MDRSAPAFFVRFCRRRGRTDRYRGDRNEIRADKTSAVPGRAERFACVSGTRCVLEISLFNVRESGACPVAWISHVPSGAMFVARDDRRPAYAEPVCDRAHVNSTDYDLIESFFV